MLRAPSSPSPLPGRRASRAGGLFRPRPHHACPGQTPTPLVSNTGRQDKSTIGVHAGFVFTQRFTTVSRVAGEDLAGIWIKLWDIDSQGFQPNHEVSS